MPRISAPVPTHKPNVAPATRREIAAIVASGRAVQSKTAPSTHAKIISENQPGRNAKRGIISKLPQEQVYDHEDSPVTHLSDPYASATDYVNYDDDKSMFSQSESIAVEPTTPEEQVAGWLSRVTRCYVRPNHLCEDLKDGVALCRLLSRIDGSGVEGGFHEAPSSKADARENVQMFFRGCQTLGLAECMELFTYKDLRAKRKNLVLEVLAGMAHELDGPFWYRIKSGAEDMSSFFSGEEEEVICDEMLIPQQNDYFQQSSHDFSVCSSEADSSDQINDEDNSDSDVELPSGRLDLKNKKNAMNRRQEKKFTKNTVKKELTLLGKAKPLNLGKDVQKVKESSTGRQQRVMSSGSSTIDQTKRAINKSFSPKVVGVQEESSEYEMSGSESEDYCQAVLEEVDNHSDFGRVACAELKKKQKENLAYDNSSVDDANIAFESDPTVDPGNVPRSNLVKPLPKINAIKSVPTTRLRGSSEDGFVVPPKSSSRSSGEKSYAARNETKPKKSKKKAKQRRKANSMSLSPSIFISEGESCSDSAYSEDEAISTSRKKKALKQSSCTSSLSALKRGTVQVSKPSLARRAPRSSKKPTGSQVKQFGKQGRVAKRKRKPVAVSFFMGMVGLVMMICAAIAVIVLAELIGLVNFRVGERLGLIRPAPPAWFF